MKWPKQVPVLKAGDFVVGPIQCKDRFCLIGWKREVFGCLDGSDAWYRLNDTLYALADDQSIFYFSTPNTPANRRTAARIWAKFIKRLGYTEDGPTVEM